MSDHRSPTSTAPVGAAPALDRSVRRHHQVTIDGQVVRYTSTTGRMVLRRERLGTAERAGAWHGEEDVAEIFYVAYVRDGAGDATARPVTYSFNGGPGSSSVWLHLGVLGPRRVPLARDPEPSPPPYGLVDNPWSLLGESDLVFIDPVSTGYSRAAVGEKPADFHGLRADVESVGDFIRLWTTRNGRWTSPTFLVGESYGTTRCAGLAEYLQRRHGLYLSGVMLISSILDFATARFEHGNDLPPLLFLPTYAATAWYHRRLADDLQGRPLRDVLDEVEAWALDRYATFLLLGDRADDALRADVGAHLSRYTGLDEAFVERCDHRIEIMRFCKELLRADGRTIGRLDSRYRGADRDGAGERPDRDPSYSAILGAYGSTLNDYVRRELGFESDLPYEVLTSLYDSWRYDEHQNRYVNVAEALRIAMHTNPHLKVHVANGYYDLATPYFATEHTFAHMALERALRENVTQSFYEAGHMMYVHEGALEALSLALRSFVRSAAAGR
ncbi:peptidase S10 [soil metagenome]